MIKASDFDDSVPLPPGLSVSAIKRAIDFIEIGLIDLVEIYFEQANVFSAVVGIYGTKALDSVSNFEKHKHLHTAQQRFPDLCRKRARKPLSPNDCLESKGSKRQYAIQSHFDHPGWYVIWRYLVDPTELIEPGRTVIIWGVDVAFLEKFDWKYEGSTAGAAGGGRTHTFGVKRPADKLRGKAVYRRSDIAVIAGKPVPINGK